MSKKPIPLYIARALQTLSIPAIALLAVCSQAQDETREEWHCGADAEGNWVCDEKTVAGRSFERPVHLESEPPAPEDEGPNVRRTRNLDWVYEEDMTDEEREKIAYGCCGAYIEPERDYPESDLDPQEANLRVAASSTAEQDNNTTQLEGNVQVTQGYRQVRGNRATFDQENRVINLEGDVLFREPGSLAVGDSAQINLDTSEAVVTNVSFVGHQAGMRGSAETLTRESSGILYFDNATYTTCEPASDAWILDMDRLSLNTNNGMATAHHSWLKVSGVPVLYVPWVRFPYTDQRATGLLFPDVSVISDNGFDYAQPIYLNLAPHYDATITPRYIADRGEMVAIEGRYLSENTYTVVSGAFLSDDDGGDIDHDEKDYTGEDRWVTGIQHEGGMGKRWSTEIDFTRVSDDDYFSDLGNTTLDVSSQTHLLQLGAVGYRFDNWDLRLEGKGYQTIIENKPDPHELLPRLTANGYYRSGDFIFKLNNQLTRFDHKDDNKNVLNDPFVDRLKIDDKGTFITGDRARLNYGVTWDKQWAWGYFRPSAEIKHLSYNLDNPRYGKTDDSPSVTVPVGIIDAGLFAERDTTWLNGYLQTLEPRLYYLNSDHKDQSDLPNFDTSELTFTYNELFRDDRFTGGDRIGDTEQLTVGLTTRLLNKATGQQFLRASIGQIFYFDDRYVTLNPAITKDIIDNPETSPFDPTDPADFTNLYRFEEQTRDESPYAGELVIQLNKNTRLKFDALYDDENSEMDKGSAMLRYKNGEHKIFNLGYRYTRRVPRYVGTLADERKIETDIEQGDISAMFPLTDNVRFVGRWNYDFTNDRDLDTFAGIQYESCCWRVTLLARRWIDRNDNLIYENIYDPEDDLEEDNGIFLQFQLKGIGGSGAKTEAILEDGIYGYQRRQ